MLMFDGNSDTGFNVVTNQVEFANLPRQASGGPNNRGYYETSSWRTGNTTFSIHPSGVQVGYYLGIVRNFEFDPGFSGDHVEKWSLGPLGTGTGFFNAGRPFTGFTDGFGAYDSSSSIGTTNSSGWVYEEMLTSMPTQFSGNIVWGVNGSQIVNQGFFFLNYGPGEDSFHINRTIPFMATSTVRIGAIILARNPTGPQLSATRAWVTNTFGLATL
jgi:hypothetical protein